MGEWSKMGSYTFGSTRKYFRGKSRRVVGKPHVPSDTKPVSSIGGRLPSGGYASSSVTRVYEGSKKTGATLIYGEPKYYTHIGSSGGGGRFTTSEGKEVVVRSKPEPSYEEVKLARERELEKSGGAGLTEKQLREYEALKQKEKQPEKTRNVDDEYRRLVEMGVVSPTEPRPSEAEIRQAYKERFLAERGVDVDRLSPSHVMVSPGLYNKYIKEVYGEFPVVEETLPSGVVVHKMIPLAKKGDIIFLESTRKQEAESFFEARKKPSKSVGELLLFQPEILKKPEEYFETPPKSVKEGLKRYSENYWGFVKGFGEEAVVKPLRGLGKFLYAPNTMGGEPLIDIGQDKIFRTDNLLEDEDVRALGRTVISFGIGYALGAVFSEAQYGLNVLGTKGLVSASARKWLLPTIGGGLTLAYGKHVLTEAKDVYRGEGFRKLGGLLGKETRSLFMIGVGSHMGYRSVGFGRIKAELEMLNAERLEAYSVFEKKMKYYERRSDVKYSGVEDSFVVPDRMKQTEYELLLPERKATFFFTTTGEPEARFKYGMMLPSENTFFVSKIRRGKFLVLETLTEEGLLETEFYRLKKGDYKLVGRELVKSKAFYTFSEPLRAESKVVSEQADLTIQSEKNLAYQGLVNIFRKPSYKGKNVLWEDTYLRAETISRGFTIQTSGKLPIVDVETGKTYPARITIKEEIPVYRFVDYEVRPEPTILRYDKEGQLFWKSPTSSKVLEEYAVTHRMRIEPGERMRVDEIPVLRDVYEPNKKFGLVFEKTVRKPKTMLFTKKTSGYINPEVWGKAYAWAKFKEGDVEAGRQLIKALDPFSLSKHRLSEKGIYVEYEQTPKIINIPVKGRGSMPDLRVPIRPRASSPFFLASIKEWSVHTAKLTPSSSPVISTDTLRSIRISVSPEVREELNPKVEVKPKSRYVQDYHLTNKPISRFMMRSEAKPEVKSELIIEPKPEAKMEFKPALKVKTKQVPKQVVQPKPIINRFLLPFTPPPSPATPLKLPSFTRMRRERGVLFKRREFEKPIARKGVGMSSYVSKTKEEMITGRPASEWRGRMREEMTMRTERKALLGGVPTPFMAKKKKKKRKEKDKGLWRL